MSSGKKIYSLCNKIYPIFRSLTGKGVLETFDLLNEYLKCNGCPEFTIHNVPSGTRGFEWTVPKEWAIRDAYIENEACEQIIDIKNNPLHILGYSTPVDEWVDLEELKKHIFIQDDGPDVSKKGGYDAIFLKGSHRLF